MSRPTKEQVDGAIENYREEAQCAIERNCAGILAAEVLALRDILARVEELLPAWRTEVSGLDSDVGFCVQDLEAALKGEP